MSPPPAPGDLEVLAERARALARPATGEEIPSRWLLVWEEGDARLALDSLLVRGVRPAEGVVALPTEAHPLVALVGDRADTVPLVSAAHLLGAATPSGVGGGVVILADTDRSPLGVLTARRPHLVEVPAATLRSAAEPPEHPAPEYVEGVTPDGVVLLDGRALLDEPDFVVTPSRGTELP